MKKNIIIKQQTLIALFLLCFSVVIGASIPPYQEIPEPGVDVSLQGMRSGQIKLTNFLIYTMHMETPGYLETNVFSYRTADKKIKPSTYVYWASGPPVETRRDLDFYLDANGKGFFTIKLPGNHIGYTRDGRFQLDSTGRLVTLADDFPVLGEGGEIVIPENTKVTVSKAGVIYADGETVDKFQVAYFTPAGRNKLVAINGVIFVSNGPPEVEEAAGRYGVRQWFLEQNNVTKATIGTVGYAKYAYEASAKVARSINKSMNSSIQMASP